MGFDGAGVDLGCVLTGAGSGEGPFGAGSGDTSASAGAAAHASMAIAHKSASCALRRAAMEGRSVAAVRPGGKDRTVIGPALQGFKEPSCPASDRTLRAPVCIARVRH